MRRGIICASGDPSGYGNMTELMACSLRSSHWREELFCLSFQFSPSSKSFTALDPSIPPIQGLSPSSPFRAPHEAVGNNFIPAGITCTRVPGLAERSLPRTRKRERPDGRQTSCWLLGDIDVTEYNGEFSDSHAPKPPLLLGQLCVLVFLGASAPRI